MESGGGGDKSGVKERGDWGEDKWVKLVKE